MSYNHVFTLLSINEVFILLLVNMVGFKKDRQVRVWQNADSTLFSKAYSPASTSPSSEKMQFDSSCSTLNGDGFGVRLEVLKLWAEDLTKRRSFMEENVGDWGKESYECPLLGKSAEVLGMRGRTLVSEVINYSATEKFRFSGLAMAS